MRWLDSTTYSVNVNLSELQENSVGQESLACCRGDAKSWT